MQCNFTFSLSVSTSFFPRKKWQNSLITSKTPIVCFPSIVLTVFWCFTSYTVIIVLGKMIIEPVISLNRWWPCTCLTCVSGLGWLERNLNFFRCIHVFDLALKFASDVNEVNWLQLFLHFVVLIGVNASVIWMKFFMLCFGFQIEVSSYCTLTETFAIGFEKWFDHEWSDCGVFVRKRRLSLTSYLHGLKSAVVAELLSFWWHRFFRCLVWGVFWSVVLKLFYFSAIGFCQIDRKAIGMQFNFFSISLCLPAFFSWSVVKFIDYSRKVNRLFPKSFVINVF